MSIWNDKSGNAFLHYYRDQRVWLFVDQTYIRTALPCSRLDYSIGPISLYQKLVLDC